MLDGVDRKLPVCPVITAIGVNSELVRVCLISLGSGRVKEGLGREGEDFDESIFAGVTVGAGLDAFGANFEAGVTSALILGRDGFNDGRRGIVAAKRRGNVM